MTELDRLRQAVADVRRLHWPFPGVPENVERDNTCDCYDGMEDCPTIAALDAALSGQTSDQSYQ